MTKSEVFNLDCKVGMKETPDKYYDVAIVDPPYGINATAMQMGSAPNRSRNDGHGSGPSVSTAVKTKGRLNDGRGKLRNRNLNKASIDWDNIIPDDEYFTELFRVSKHQIIWGGNYFNLPPTRGIVAWNKLQPWENFSQFELAWTSFDVPAKMFTMSNTGGNKEKKIHPTQKPIELYRYLIDRFVLPYGYTNILDTHLGSGSSRIAADEYKIEFTGYETNKMHFDDQEKRYQKYKSQVRLF